MREEQRDPGQPIIEIESGDGGRQPPRIDDLGHQPRAAAAIFDRQLADAVADARRRCDQDLRRRRAGTLDDVNRSGGGFFRRILHRHADEPFLPLEIAVVHGFDSRSVLYVAGERDCRLPVDRADIGASHGRDEIGNVARQQIRCLGIFQTLQPRLSICGGRPQRVAHHGLAGDRVALKARVDASLRGIAWEYGP